MEKCIRRGSHQHSQAASTPVSRPTGIGDYLWRVYPGIYHTGPLSLAIPFWLGVISTGDGFDQRW